MRAVCALALALLIAVPCNSDDAIDTFDVGRPFLSGRIGGFASPDGKEKMQCPLPGSQHQQNTGGIDGAGLCVYASERHSGRWQNDPLFDALFDYMKTQEGGSYPAKFAATVKSCAKLRGYPVPNYVQIQDNDIEVLKLACKNGYMPGVTYGYSPTGRYGGRRISHMVSITHATDNWFAVLDNNYIGDKQFEWLKPTEFARSHTTGGTGWKIILLTVPPPPKPYMRAK